MQTSAIPAGVEAMEVATSSTSNVASNTVILRHMTDDQQVLPGEADAIERLCTYFDLMPSIGIVAAKRCTSTGTIFSMGDRVIHPKGFHHVGHGYPAEAFRFPEEVDGVNAGLIAVDRLALESVGGFNDDFGSLSMLDLCLRLRGAGYRCLVVPEVVIEGEHPRLQPSREEARAFRRRWNFRWRCADLDAVRQRYTGTGLLWDARIWGQSMPFAKYEQREAMHWTSYEDAPPYRERADYLASLIVKLTPDGVALDIGCGDGLFTHLVAMQGCATRGIDPESIAIEQARTQTATQQYPNTPPEFDVTGGATTSLDDGSCATAFMLDVIEHLPNPIAVLQEASRVLRPGGRLVVTTPQAQLGGSSDPIYHITEFEPHELHGLINAVPGLKVIDTARIGGIYRDLVVIAEKQM